MPETRLAGLRAGPRDQVNVCSYLVHRNPRHWSDPDAFRPQRWAEQTSEAFIPFGYGRHSCAAAGEAVALLESVVEAILRQRPLRVRAHEREPFISSALAPPPFTLSLGEPSRPGGGG
jgi:cytochrome P450